MIQHSGVDWIVEKFDSGHSPFLSQPAELAVCLARLADNFAAVGHSDEAGTWFVCIEQGIHFNLYACLEL